MVATPALARPAITASSTRSISLTAKPIGYSLDWPTTGMPPAPTEALSPPQGSTIMTCRLQFVVIQLGSCLSDGGAFGYELADRLFGVVDLFGNVENLVF